MAVLSYNRRLVCAAKRTGASPTLLRAGLLRQRYEYRDLRNAPLWAALIVDAGVEFPEDLKKQRTMGQEFLNALLDLSGDEITEAVPKIVADILARKRDILEGVDQ